mgnify:CR=1 FL=1
MALRSLEFLFFKSFDKILSLSNFMFPSLVLSKPAIDFKIVDLPLPDSPTSAIVSPLLTSILISFTVGFVSEILFKI